MVKSETPPWPLHSNGRLTINLDAIVANWKKLGAMASHGQCAAVVKADAYGLGATAICERLYREGCRDFFTATIFEGMTIRPLVTDARVYIFNGFNPAATDDYRDYRLTPVINSPLGVCEWLSAERSGMRCGLHLDTGANRLGITPSELAGLVSDSAMINRLDPELVISHFACADDPGHEMNLRQVCDFTAAAAHFPGARKSLANSAGIFHGSHTHFDLLRPGIALYGAEAVNDVVNPMQPVVRLEGRILQLKWAKKGETVGYGAAELLKRDTRLAIVAIGYADGLHRQASGAGTLYRHKTMSPGGMGMIGGHKIPILGRISMDMTVFDVTDIPEPLIAKGGWIDLVNDAIRVDDLARAAGTIGYEILTSLGRRYERIYPGE